MSVPQSPVITPAAGWENAGRGRFTPPPANRGCQQTRNVVYHQQVSKMGCALFPIRQVVVLEVWRRSGPGKAGLALDPKSFF